jgi:hypothetical protein
MVDERYSTIFLFKDTERTIDLTARFVFVPQILLPRNVCCRLGDYGSKIRFPGPFTGCENVVNSIFPPPARIFNDSEAGFSQQLMGLPLAACYRSREYQVFDMCRDAECILRGLKLGD